MKVKIITHSILIAIILIYFQSCRSSKDLQFMQDLRSNEMIYLKTDTLKDYVIRPGNVLFVSIKSMNPEINALFNPEANMENNSYSSSQKYTTPQGAYLYGYEVSPEGAIHLPIIGEVTVAGYLQPEVEQIVQGRANQYLKDATVKVKLLNYKVTVLGEVRNPGVFYNYNNSLTVLEAIAMANGNTDFANIKEIKIIRPSESGYQTYRLNLQAKDAWKNKGFYLFPNDYVLVESARTKNLNLNSQAYSMFISSISILIAILSFSLK